MRKNLAVLVVGLAAALGVPAVAQAAVTPSGAGNASAGAGIRPAVSTNCDNDQSTLWSYHTGDYGGLGSTPFGVHALQFSPPQDGETNICATNYGGNEYNLREVLGNQPDLCISLDSTNEIIGWETACGYTWDKWEPTKVSTYHSQSVFILRSVWNTNLCMDLPTADNPATYATCSTTNQAEWFSDDALP